MRSIYAGLLTVLFLFLPAAVSNATEPAPSGGIGIRLVDIPEAAQTDPRARTYIVDNLPPGTTIERRVEVQNTTAERQSVAVYAAAAEVKDGAFTGLDRDTQNELSGWIAMDAPTVDLPAGESAEVRVRIAVPADAPEGEQYAALWAEVQSAPTEGTQVITASRVGIRVYLSVGPGNGPPAALTIGGLTAGRSDDGAPQVTADVTNTGGRALDVQGELRLTDGPGGLAAGPVSLDGTVTLAPGETAPVSVTFAPELPSGAWHARLDLKSGLITAQAAADLTFSDAAEAPAREPGNPALVGAAVAAVLLLAGAALWLIRRRKTAAAAE